MTLEQFIIQMYSFDSNQQSPHYRKRKCVVYRPNDFFQAFDFSQHQIISSFQSSAESVMIKSLAILVDNIRNSSKRKYNEHFSPKRFKQDIKETLYSFKKNNLTFKKEINQPAYDEQNSTNPEQQMKQLVQYEKTGKKATKSTNKMEYCVQEKAQQPNYVQTKKHEKLINSLKRLTVQEQFRQLEQEIENISHIDNRNDTQYTDLLKFDEEILKKKSITEMITQSNVKAKKTDSKQYSPIESQNSQYEMTDHSSNESSNDQGDYEERFAFQSDKIPLFGTIFSQGQKYKFSSNNPTFKSGISTDSVHHPPPKLNFKPLLNSPKKDKTKKKRLYINKKKVPRWAQDRQQVSILFGSEAQKKLRNKAHQIFGICIVEDMQTNSIFNRKDEYVRSSTVKWQRQKKYLI